MIHDRRLYAFSLWLSLLLLVAPGADARAPEEATPSTAPRPAAAGPAGDTPRFREAQTYFRGMQGAVSRAERLRDDAARRKDRIKLNCITDKLVPLDGYVRQAQRAILVLADAPGRSGADEHGRAHAQVAGLYRQVLILAAEADACMGEDSRVAAGTTVEVEVNPAIPRGEVTDPGLPRPDLVNMLPGLVQPYDEDSPPM